MTKVDVKELRLCGTMSKWGKRYPMHRRLEVPNTRKITKEPMVTVNIVPGKANEYRKRLLRLLWLHLLDTPPSESKVESETKGENKTKP